MKNLKIFAVTVFMMLFFTSCEKGVNPHDPVGMSVAISHCAESAAYWIFGILVTLAGLFGAYKMKKLYDKDGTFSPLLAFGILAAILFVWLYRPSEIAWNTTVEQAARNVWIGY